MGLKEILAAKKAAAAAAEQEKASEQSSEKDTEAVSEADDSSGSDNPAADDVADSQPAEQSRSVEASMLQDDELQKPAQAAPAKPMTFAEKMALKKQGIQAAQAAPSPKPTAPVIDPAMIPDDPVTAADYVDIKTRIHALESLFDDDLAGAMAELKAALKKNPAATELMLDEDIGKMVISLRRMTHVAVVEATAGKKAGRKSTPKAKDAPLTKEEIEAAFAEL